VLHITIASIDNSDTSLDLTSHVMAKVRERLAVNKQRSHTFDMERFNLKKLNDVESKELYNVEV
jgi:hypothetical protein